MMPGPVSDTYDPIFSTATNRADVEACAARIDKVVTRALRDAAPLPIVSVAQAQPRKRGMRITCTLREYDWRMIRFALRVVQGTDDC